ncbi:MAG: hypothetical protein R3F39_11315 [Myxococcota bacterium]
MLAAWSFAVWILGSAAATVNPGTLLVSMEAREAYLARWEGSMAVVRYTPPAETDDDPDFRPWHEVAGAVVELGGPVSVVAPLLALRGVDEVEVRFRDGRSSPARVLQPKGDHDAIPLVRLELRDPTVLKGRLVLGWADADSLVSGAYGWTIESADFRPPDGSEAPPVLVDAAVGEPVEWPLDRLHYIGLARADGRPILDADGKILCIVYRQVPGMERTSLCVGRDDALRAVKPRERKVEEPKPVREAPAVDLP